MDTFLIRYPSTPCPICSQRSNHNLFPPRGKRPRPLFSILAMSEDCTGPDPRLCPPVQCHSRSTATATGTTSSNTPSHHPAHTSTRSLLRADRVTSAGRGFSCCMLGNSTHAAQAEKPAALHMGTSSSRVQLHHTSPNEGPTPEARNRPIPFSLQLIKA